MLSSFEEGTLYSIAKGFFGVAAQAEYLRFLSSIFGNYKFGNFQLDLLDYFALLFLLLLLSLLPLLRLLWLLMLLALLILEEFLLSSSSHS